MAKINITESQLKKVIAEATKKVLMEAGYGESAKKMAYSKITQAINDFKKFLETTYDLNSPDSESSKLWEDCNYFQTKLDDFFRHPDLGGDYKTWDSAEF